MYIEYTTFSKKWVKEIRILLKKKEYTYFTMYLFLAIYNHRFKPFPVKINTKQSLRKLQHYSQRKNSNIVLGYIIRSDKRLQKYALQIAGTACYYYMYIQLVHRIFKKAFVSCNRIQIFKAFFPFHYWKIVDNDAPICVRFSFFLHFNPQLFIIWIKCCPLVI